ncbi:hypothetical protein BH18ACI5_BH18ACI5_09980 [soil metagenome]
MNTVLLITTGVSLVIAAGLGVQFARMLREERRRSDARVHLLSELSGRASAPASVRRPATQPIAAPPSPAAQATVARPAPIDDFELRPAARESATVQDLFHERGEPSAWPRRFAVIGAMSVLLALSIVSYRLLGVSSAAPAQHVTGRPAEPTVNSDAPPLELLTMRHGTADGVLTITGQVRNPRSGRTLRGVNATVLVFGPGGSFMTNMRTPLDYTALAPGEESPFVIQVPLTGTVERYRIGFRTDDGRVLSHVDRRSPDTLAQRQLP